MNKTRYKTWVCKDLEDKPSGKNHKSNSQRNKERLQKLAEAQHDLYGGESSDHYDPLADSDGSSERSESPIRLTGPELQESIKKNMRDGTTENVI